MVDFEAQTIEDVLHLTASHGDRTQWEVYCRSCALDGVQTWLGVVFRFRERRRRLQFVQYAKNHLTGTKHLRYINEPSIDCHECGASIPVDRASLKRVQEFNPTQPALL